MKKIALAASVVAVTFGGYVLAAGNATSEEAKRLVLLKANAPVFDEINVAPTSSAADANSGKGRVIAAAAGKGIPDAYICVFKTGEVPQTESRRAATEAVRRGGGTLGHVYDVALQGFSVLLPAQAVRALVDRNPNIEWCEQDQATSIVDPLPEPVNAKSKLGSGTSSGEVTPPGILAVNGGQAYSGAGRAWVIDTGIDLSHPDLNVDTARSVSFLARDTSPQDFNGHGTHVAGTIAAKSGNGIGVVGVAAGASVISIRVLDRRGAGTISDAIAGVNYVAANGVAGDVANMSLVSDISPGLDAAVLRASARVKFALAAGNYASDASMFSPARQNGPNIFTVAAMNWDGSAGTWAGFSNYNPSTVDYIEPGVDVFSTWLGGGYNTSSGTSMAAPHMAGLLLWGAPRAGGMVARTGATDSYRIAKR